MELLNWQPFTGRGTEKRKFSFTYLLDDINFVGMKKVYQIESSLIQDTKKFRNIFWKQILFLSHKKRRGFTLKNFSRAFHIILQTYNQSCWPQSQTLFTKKNVLFVFKMVRKIVFTSEWFHVTSLTGHSAYTRLTW